ncbi:MAG: hypothetical protein ACO39Z_09965 [Paracoccaceae bacterium]|jgi:hypothetical protein
MIIDRNSRVPKQVNTIAKPREGCLNCKDCQGTCWQIFEMWSLPEALSRRGAK